MSAEAQTAEAYRHCEALTRAAAANFHYGIRLLPGDKRRAMCAVYAFARRVDDIGDGALQPAEKLRRLDAAADALGELARSHEDPAIAALADAHERFALPLQSLHDLIEGVRMDVRGTSYGDFDELVLYCRRVAGSIGRLCLAIFGSRDPGQGAFGWGRGHGPDDTAGPPGPGVCAGQLADDLGVAMQLTNILRDLREDAERGRVYVPAEDLVRYHLHDDDPLSAEQMAALAREGAAEPDLGRWDTGSGDTGQLYALMRFQAHRANEWFERGIVLVELLDRRSAACVLAMTGIYRQVLLRIEDQPQRPLRERVSLPMREKAWVAARGVLAGARGGRPAERGR